MYFITLLSIVHIPLTLVLPLPLPRRHIYAITTATVNAKIHKHLVNRKSYGDDR
jgi:hypothetical protein